MDLSNFGIKCGKENSIEFLQAQKNLLEGTVGAKKIETEVAEETFMASATKNTKKKSNQKIWVDKGPEVDEKIENICEAVKTQFYQTMKETKAASERSSKIILYCYP